MITAGPTREPIDDVRFIGNRSSGTLGIELARAAAELGWQPVLALGASVPMPNIAGAEVLRFDRTQDLRSLLVEHMPLTDMLVMAAAVADHTPKTVHAGKLRRDPDQPLTIELVPTEDLLAESARHARPDQLIVGFALEPADQLSEAARAKLERKGVDLIVANPLGTMESGSIHATIIARPLFESAFDDAEVALPKPTFAKWLLPKLAACHAKKAGA